jgi:Meiotically Up-regulated Gene 113 (MUG113) protein
MRFSKSEQELIQPYMDESYDDRQERITGERPQYDESGREQIPNWMIDDLSVGSRKRPKPNTTPHKRVGYVYLLAVSGHPGLYKIGRAANPENRLRTFNVKLPFPVSFACIIPTDDMYKLEKELHIRYANLRTNGEFFALSSDDVAYIKSLVDKSDLINNMLDGLK